MVYLSERNLYTLGNCANHPGQTEFGDNLAFALFTGETDHRHDGLYVIDHIEIDTEKKVWKCLPPNRWYVIDTSHRRVIGDFAEMAEADDLCDHWNDVEKKYYREPCIVSRWAP